MAENGDFAEPTVPEGFVCRDRPSPLTDPWEPIYSRQWPDRLDLGLWLRQAHCNARGFVHGGLIAALADNAMGHSCGLHRDSAGLVTVSLNIDYLGIAHPGAWLEVNCKVIKSGRSMSFAQCLVSADGAPCARGNATFRAVSA